MTSIAVMQCVEKGLLNLDDDVSHILHEFKDIEILTGFDGDGNPRLVKAKKKVTLRWDKKMQNEDNVLTGWLID